MSLIGRRCKHSNVFSWPILIDRGLEPSKGLSKFICGVARLQTLFGSLWIWTTAVSVFDSQGPPVPIPNTEVKLWYADNTWVATLRKDRSMLTPDHLMKVVFFLAVQRPFFTAISPHQFSISTNQRICPRMILLTYFTLYDILKM